jgi:hypothetical protein
MSANPTPSGDGARSIREQYAQDLVELDTLGDAESLLSATLEFTKKGGLPAQSFDAARMVLYLGASRDEGAPPAFGEVVGQLNGLIRAVYDAEYEEYSPDGNGVRYRGVEALVEQAKEVASAIRVWEETLGVQP